jgi:hypothetical protein
VLPDDFLLETLRAFLVTHPEIKTPVQLFNFLKLQTNYSTLISPHYEVAAKQQQPSSETGLLPYEKHSPISCSTLKLSDQAFNPKYLSCTESHTSTPIKYSHLDQEKSFR